MCFDHSPCFGSKLHVHSEQFRVIERTAPLGRDQEIKPATQPLRSGTVLGHHLCKWLRSVSEPPFGHCAAECCLTRTYPAFTMSAIAPLSPRSALRGRCARCGRCQRSPFRADAAYTRES